MPGGGSDLLGRALTFSGVTLDDGAFEIDAGGDQFPSADMQKVFGSGGNIWIEVRDASHNVVYPRQRLSAVPFAGRVPVDGKTLAFDTSGNLALVAGSPTPGQVLTTDAAGKLSWGTPAAGASGTITSLLAGTGLTVSGGAAAITTTGTLNVNVGNGAGQIPQLDSSGRLPTLDASQLTSLNGSALQNSSVNLTTKSTGVLPVANGGTGSATVPSNGQIPIGNGTGYALANLTAGTGINISNASGAVTIATTVDPTTKLSKSGDTMSGVLNLPADGLVVGTNELVAAGGHIGIGTASPGQSMHIYNTSNSTSGLRLEGTSTGSSSFTELQLKGDARQYSVGVAGSGTSGPANKFYVYDATASAYRFVMDPAGNVGIGTTNPGSLLDVQGNAASGGIIQSFVNNANSAGSARMSLAAGGGGTLSLEAHGSSSTYGSASSGNARSPSGADIYWSGTGEPLGIYAQQGTRFFAGGDSASYERMRITSTGKVGIGTSSPAYPLHVKSASGTSDIVMIDTTDTSGTPSYAYLSLGKGGNAMWSMANNGGSGDYLSFNDQANSQRMVIKQNGNVGIGTSSPGATLQVNGSLALGVSTFNTSSYSVASLDSVIIANPSVSSTITLPSCSAGANPGRLLVVVNKSTYGVTLSGTTYPGSLTLSSGQTSRLVCDANSTWTQF